MAVSRFAEGNTEEGVVREWFRKLYKYPTLLSKYPCLATLVADVLSLRTVRVWYPTLLSLTSISLWLVC
jgi:hypothetical protein